MDQHFLYCTAQYVPVCTCACVCAGTFFCRLLRRRRFFCRCHSAAAVPVSSIREWNDVVSSSSRALKEGGVVRNGRLLCHAIVVSLLQCTADYIRASPSPQTRFFFSFSFLLLKE